MGKSYEKILRETGEWTYVKKFDEKVPWETENGMYTLKIRQKVP